MKLAKNIATVSGILIVAFAVNIIMPTQTQPQPVSASQTDTVAPTCPAGSYAIDYNDGAPICKQEPTGCPYGDSIPLGAACDKHAPEAPAVTPVSPAPQPTKCGEAQ